LQAQQQEKIASAKARRDAEAKRAGAAYRPALSADEVETNAAGSLFGTPAPALPGSAKEPAAEPAAEVAADPFAKARQLMAKAEARKQQPHPQQQPSLAASRGGGWLSRADELAQAIDQGGDGLVGGTGD
jgi:hypothetical protein